MAVSTLARRLAEPWRASALDPLGMVQNRPFELDSSGGGAEGAALRINLSRVTFQTNCQVRLKHALQPVAEPTLQLTSRRAL
jgi:hypothetical protein